MGQIIRKTRMGSNDTQRQVKQPPDAENAGKKECREKRKERPANGGISRVVVQNVNAIGNRGRECVGHEGLSQSSTLLVHGSHASPVVVPIKVEGPQREIVLPRRVAALVQHDSLAAIGATPGVLLLILRDGRRGTPWRWLGRRQWREPVDRKSWRDGRSTARGRGRKTLGVSRTKLRRGNRITSLLFCIRNRTLRRLVFFYVSGTLVCSSLKGRENSAKAQERSVGATERVSRRWAGKHRGPVRLRWRVGVEDTGRDLALALAHGLQQVLLLSSHRDDPASSVHLLELMRGPQWLLRELVKDIRLGDGGDAT